MLPFDESRQPVGGSRAAEDADVLQEMEPEPEVYGQFVGQVLRADGTPCEGGMIGFLQGDFGLDQRIRRFPVRSDGQYTTGAIPTTAYDPSATPYYEAPIPAGLYTPLYREPGQESREVLENLYDSTSSVTVPADGVLTQDFMLRQGVVVVGSIKVDLDFIPGSSSDLGTPLFLLGGPNFSDLIAVGKTKTYGSSNTRRRKSHAARFAGDEPGKIESGDFSFFNVPPGDYHLKLCIVVGPTAERRSLVHITSAFSVGLEDLFLEPETVQWEEFRKADPAIVRRSVVVEKSR